MKKKGLVLILSLVLVLSFAAVGTFAWLTATSDVVTNTFTTSNISITLEESENLDLKMIPGYTIEKDPEVTVKAGSEACYLFVKLEKSENYDTYLTHELADGWKKLEGTDADNVYYREVDAAEEDQAFSVLKNDQVTVNGEVTMEDMEAAKTDQPTLTITAYASQYQKNATDIFTAVEAWANIS